jgi:hypothetical protein
VSPGWWPLVASLFQRDNDVVVQVCHEADGELHLEATSRLTTPDALQGLLRRIRENATKVCGACGRTPATAYHRRPGQPIRVVCDACRRRLDHGEDYLDLAVSYWRMDGSPRPQPSAAGAAFTTRAPGTASPEKRTCTALPPDELRRVVNEIRSALQAEIVGQDSAVSRLALLAGLHIGGGLPRGGRALILGPSGVGKTSLLQALRRALEPWDVAWVVTDALDLTSAGWSGAPSIGDLIKAALDGAAPDSPRARRAVVVIDELHHARRVHDTTGNMLAKREEVLASLLGLTGHGTVHFGEGTEEWSSREALVIGMGAFTDLIDLSRPVSVKDIVRAGLPLELATRLAEEIIVLEPLRERDLIGLLRRWPALVSLIDVCNRLGYPVRVHDEAYTRAARVVTLGLDGSTPRTAGGWLVAALRHALIGALEGDELCELVIIPDSLPIPRTATRRRPPDDPPDGHGLWDATIVLTPR